MKLLLDTHLLLWWLTNDKSLGREAKKLVGDPDNAVFVSSVTMWELWLKQSLGKLRLPAGFDERLEDEGFEPLNMTAEHARQVGELPWLHRDPFGRMLVAQAECEGLTLLTADETLAGYGGRVRVLR